MSLTPGTIFGPYRILGQLGAGGMASVYHAFQTAPEREVALKVISPELVALPAFRARFEREAAVLARLEHPNILPVYATGEVDGQPYICYRYVRGGTLRDLVGAPLPPAEITALLGPVASALDFAHRQGVVHRDVKPANILLTVPDEAGRRTPIVADFGVARLLAPAVAGGDRLSAAPADATALTQIGVGLGTPAYMAPEQVRGREVDGRADQYALAITAYQMLTGVVPFTATTPAEVAFMQVTERVPLPSTRVPGIGAAVEHVLLTGLAKAPEDRYPSCAAFVQALAAAAVPALSQPEPLHAAETEPALSLAAPDRTVEEEPAPVVPNRPLQLEPTLPDVRALRRDPVQPPAVAARPGGGRVRRRVFLGGGAALVLGGGVTAGIAWWRSRSGGGPSTPGIAAEASATVPSVTRALPSATRPSVASVQPGVAATVATIATGAKAPRGLAADGSTLYVSDMAGHVIRRVPRDGGASTVLAGTGVAGYRDGPFSTAQFNRPSAITLDAGGTLYVADTGNNRLRLVTPAGQVTTLAGSGVAGNADGPFATAQFSDLNQIALGTAGTIYLVEYHAGSLRVLSPNGQVRTVKVLDPSKQEVELGGIAVDAKGTIYVSDGMLDGLLVVAADGSSTLLAGSGRHGFADGAGLAAQFALPSGLALDGAGMLYVADFGNNRVRMVTPAGLATTLAGAGVAGARDGPASAAQFNEPLLVAVAPDGTVYVAEDTTVRQITRRA